MHASFSVPNEPVAQLSKLSKSCGLDTDLISGIEITLFLFRRYHRHEVFLLHISLMVNGIYKKGKKGDGIIFQKKGGGFIF